VNQSDLHGPPVAVTVFGASGDLTRPKPVPALRQSDSRAALERNYVDQVQITAAESVGVAHLPACSKQAGLVAPDREFLSRSSGARRERSPT